MWDFRGKICLDRKEMTKSQHQPHQDSRGRAAWVHVRTTTIRGQGERHARSMMQVALLHAHSRGLDITALLALCWPQNLGPDKVLYLSVLVGWAICKRLINRLPKLGPRTLSPPGTAGYSRPDRIYGLTWHQLAVPIYGDPGRVCFRFDMRKFNFS